MERTEMSVISTQKIQVDGYQSSGDAVGSCGNRLLSSDVNDNANGCLVVSQAVTPPPATQLSDRDRITAMDKQLSSARREKRREFRSPPSFPPNVVE
ncbi:MAG: hypothetical protein LBR91_01575 [Puniceicoccales bacterium]|jgi:hypothetical protein|nr:hypothetical protein [Puniceicoccales bacterium]